MYSASLSARLAQASPSVSVEKGAYRMRAPPRTRSPSKLQRRRLHEHSPAAYEKQMALLVVFLVSATIACFGAAYYLFTTRWEPSALPAHAPADAVQVVRFASDTVPPEEWDEGERFLAYLPHSGFHNQRIAFENALVLARLLNRTLVVPPVRLGAPLSYAPFDELHALLANSSKLGLDHCRTAPSPDLAVLPECTDYFEYTHVPWDWLVDLSQLKTEQRLLQRWDFSDAWLTTHLRVGPDDTFTLRDSARTDYAFADFTSFDPAASPRKYAQALHITALARRPERLLQLGTLFGSARLHLRTPAHLALRAHVRRSMALANPHLAAAADAVCAALAAPFLAAHLRLGGALFAPRARATVRAAWWRLLAALALDPAPLERRLFPADPAAPPPPLAPDVPALRAPHPPLPPLPARPACAARALHPALGTPLFVATDAPGDAALARLARTFPCTVGLADFPAATAALAALRGADGAPLGRLLLPLLDALVAGRAWAVVGTEGSTFSAYVADVLWRTHHGWAIVQRG